MSLLQEAIRQPSRNLTLSHLTGAVDLFAERARNFTRRAAAVDASDPLAVRALNDQIMGLDRAFLLPGGLPFQAGASRHAVFAPGARDAFGAQVFPGLADLTRGLRSLTTEEQLERYEALRRHLSDLMITVLQAADHLKELHIV